MESFQARYPAVAAALDERYANLSIDCTEKESDYDGKLVLVAAEKMARSGSSVHREQTLVVAPDPIQAYFFAISGTPAGRFTVGRSHRDSPLHLSSSDDEAEPITRTRVKMKPVYAATCCLDARLADLLAEPTTRFLGASAQTVPPFGEVVRVEFDQQADGGVTVHRTVYLDRETWAIVGYELAMPKHPVGQPPATLEGVIEYERRGEMLLPKTLEYWSDVPAKPGVRVGDDRFDVTAATVGPVSPAVFSLSRYELGTPNRARRATGLRWLPWVVGLVLTATGMILYLRTRRRAAR